MPHTSSHCSDHNVLILGDSACATIGCSNTNFITLFGSVYWDNNVNFINTSGVGMTSADILIHAKEIAENKSIQLAIIYIGNCDPCAFGIHKPRMTFYTPQKVLKNNQKILSENNLYNRCYPLLHAPKADFKSSLLPAVSSKDYFANIKNVVKYLINAKIQVLLVIPSSKVDFPPCNNIGNFFCYKLFCIEDNLQINTENTALSNALESHNAGRLDDASRQYRLLIEDGQPELVQIATNNLADICFRNKSWAEADRLLQPLLEHDSPMAPIFFFNLAMLAKTQGNLDRCRQLLQQGVDLDLGTYRANTAYQKAALELAQQFSGKIDVIDLRGILSDSDFVDYCHPRSTGHDLLHGHVKQCLENRLSLGPGPHLPTITYSPVNPDRYAGYTSDFFSHYGFISHEIDPSFAETARHTAASLPFEAVLEQKSSFERDKFTRSRNILLSHPLFGTSNFLDQHPPDQSCDQGRAPELYFLRNVFSLYLATDPKTAFPALTCLSHFWLQEQCIAPWWHHIGPEPTPIKDLDNAMQQMDWGEVLDRVHTLLHLHLNEGPQIYNRIRTITYWFFRESIRFGTTSSHFAMTDRMSLSNIMDTCLVALYFIKDDNPLSSDFKDITRIFESTIGIHDKHLGKWAHAPYSMPHHSFLEYASDMKSLLQTLDTKINSST